MSGTTLFLERRCKGKCSFTRDALFGNILVLSCYEDRARIKILGAEIAIAVFAKRTKKRLVVVIGNFSSQKKENGVKCEDNG